jgi:hypothetical protein
MRDDIAEMRPQNQCKAEWLALLPIDSLNATMVTSASVIMAKFESGHSSFWHKRR